MWEGMIVPAGEGEGQIPGGGPPGPASRDSKTMGLEGHALYGDTLLLSSLEPGPAEVAGPSRAREASEGPRGAGRAARSAAAALSTVRHRVARHSQSGFSCFPLSFLSGAVFAIRTPSTPRSVCFPRGPHARQDSPPRPRPAACRRCRRARRQVHEAGRRAAASNIEHGKLPDLFHQAGGRAGVLVKSGPEKWNGGPERNSNRKKGGE